MDQYLAVLPFVVIVVSVLSIITIMDWLNNRKVGENLKDVAAATNGNLEKKDGNYVLTGSYYGREFTIFMKQRGAGKNKALYYHVSLESSSSLRLVCLKRYVKSRLEAKINDMYQVELPDEDFAEVHKVVVDNLELGQQLVNNPGVEQILKNIMEKYTEMRIKKDITLLKRYHVKLTEPDILLNTIENLVKIAMEVEKLNKVKV